MKSSEIFFAICTLIFAQKGSFDRRSFNHEVHEWNVKHGLARPLQVTKLHHMRPRRENEGKKVPTSYNLSWDYNKVPIHNQKILHQDKVKIPSVKINMPYYIPQEHEILQEHLPKPLPLRKEQPVMRPSYYPPNVPPPHHCPIVHKSSTAVRQIYKTNVNGALSGPPTTAWRPIRPPHKQIFYKHPEDMFYNYQHPAGPQFKKKINHFYPEKYIESSNLYKNSNIQKLTYQELNKVHTQPINSSNASNGQQHEKLPSPQSYTSVRQYSYDDSTSTNQTPVVSTKEEEKEIHNVPDISSLPYTYLSGQVNSALEKEHSQENNKQTVEIPQQYEHLPVPQSYVSQNILTHQQPNNNENKVHAPVLSEHYHNTESIAKVEKLPLAQSYAEIKFPKQDIKNVSLQVHSNSEESNPQQVSQEVQPHPERQNSQYVPSHELPNAPSYANGQNHYSQQHELSNAHSYANVQNHHSQQGEFVHPNQEYYPYQYEPYSYQPPPHPVYAVQQNSESQGRGRGHPYYYQPVRYTMPADAHHARYVHQSPSYPHIHQNDVKYQVQSKNIEHSRQTNLYNQYSHEHEYENDYVDVLVPMYGDYYGHDPRYQAQEQPVVEENNTGRPQQINYSQVESKLPQTNISEKSPVDKNEHSAVPGNNKNQIENGKVSEYEIQISHGQWKPIENPSEIKSIPSFETSNLPARNSTL